MHTRTHPVRPLFGQPVNGSRNSDGHFATPLDLIASGCNRRSVSEIELSASELFDNHASAYRQTVDTAVRYSGKDLAFFTASKAYHLLEIAGRLGTPIEQAALLDVGCGIGGLHQLLAPRAGRLVGVDVSEGMLGSARHANPGVDYLHYSGRQLPFGDETFDLVFAVCVIHHVHPREWSPFVSEMWRVTRPGGATVIIEHNPLNPLTRRSVSACAFDDDAVLTGPRPLVHKLRSLGARRVRSRYFLFTPFGAHVVQAVERRLLARLPLGAQYLVEAAR
jgi:SAM-dependent methyltransferase